MGLVGTITVTPEVLEAKGTELRTVVNGVKIQLSEMGNIIRATSSYWIGEAGDLLRKNYLELNEEVEDILNTLSVYPTQLEEMAGIYNIAQSNALQKAAELPGNVLE